MEQAKLFEELVVRMGGRWFVVIRYWTGSWQTMFEVTEDEAIRVTEEAWKNGAEEAV
jgi:hypothetical protein